MGAMPERRAGGVALTLGEALPPSYTGSTSAGVAKLVDAADLKSN